jgi:ferredoxin-type protein NapH
MKLRWIRRCSLAAVFLLVSVGLILKVGTGTLSSLGWQAIAAICPLGVLETVVASKTIFLRALIVLGLAAVFILIFGKVFCSWICPVAPARGLLRVIEKKRRKPDTGCTLCTSSSCATKRAKWDSRHLILGGSLLSAAIFGFPVFCLVCPIGLIFGTVILLWQWLSLDTVSLSLLVYPAILIAELLLLRKWCAKFCPLGALLSLMSLPNRFLRPRIDTSKCLREQGKDCAVCCESCPEDLDPHFKNGMNECSKCGLCWENCPAQAISIPFGGGKGIQGAGGQSRKGKRDG